MEEETKAQRGQETCPRSHSRWGVLGIVIARRAWGLKEKWRRGAAYFHSTLPLPPCHPLFADEWDGRIIKCWERSWVRHLTLNSHNIHVIHMIELRYFYPQQVRKSELPKELQFTCTANKWWRIERAQLGPPAKLEIPCPHLPSLSNACGLWAMLRSPQSQGRSCVYPAWLLQP